MCISAWAVVLNLWLLALCLRPWARPGIKAETDTAAAAMEQVDWESKEWQHWYALISWYCCPDTSKDWEPQSVLLLDPFHLKSNFPLMVCEESGCPVWRSGGAHPTFEPLLGCLSTATWVPGRLARIGPGQFGHGRRKAPGMQKQPGPNGICLTGALQSSWNSSG